jgi:hypothetical protein
MSRPSAYPRELRARAVRLVPELRPRRRWGLPPILDDLADLGWEGQVHGAGLDGGLWPDSLYRLGQALSVKVELDTP